MQAFLEELILLGHSLEHCIAIADSIWKNKQTFWFYNQNLIKLIGISSERMRQAEPIVQEDHKRKVAHLSLPLLYLWLHDMKTGMLESARISFSRETNDRQTSETNDRQTSCGDPIYWV